MLRAAAVPDAGWPATPIRAASTEGCAAAAHASSKVRFGARCDAIHARRIASAAAGAMPAWRCARARHLGSKETRRARCRRHRGVVLNRGRAASSFAAARVHAVSARAAAPCAMPLVRMRSVQPCRCIQINRVVLLSNGATPPIGRLPRPPATQRARLPPPRVAGGGAAAEERAREAPQQARPGVRRWGVARGPRAHLDASPATRARAPLRRTRLSARAAAQRRD